MENKHNTDLTSAEISMLWSNYMADTMATCVLQHFEQTCHDESTLPVIKFALDTSKKHTSKIEEIFTEENIPIPIGFGEGDVNLHAPKLFSDITYLRYLHHMGRSGIVTYALAKAVVTRDDVRDHFSQALSQVEKLMDMSSDLMLEQGVYVRSPYIHYPQQIDYVTDHDFLGHFFGKQRPLLAVEVTHLGTNIEVTNVAKTLLLAFSQVSQDKKVKDYLTEGYEIGRKQVDAFFTKLKENDTSYPSTWDSSITNSTESPFSDKLIMFQVLALNSFDISDFGTSISASMRKDLTVLYSKFTVELGMYAEKGAKLLMDKGWFEKPPQTLDREELRRQSLE